MSDIPERLEAPTRRAEEDPELLAALHNKADARTLSHLWAKAVANDPERVARLQKVPKSSGLRITKEEFLKKYL